MGMPKPTAERLSQLVRLLEQQGTRTTPISSAEIEVLTGWPSNTIRKDISFIEASSEISNNSGYDPQKLSQAIKKSLGFGVDAYKCCIVGLGRLGSAFLDYSGFKDSPFQPLAGFDSNVNRLEILKAGFPLYPTFKMKEVIGRLGIQYAILCVPPAQAQLSAEKLIDCGISGIVNFTPSILSVPERIEIENVSVIEALGNLSARLVIKKNNL